MGTLNALCRGRECSPPPPLPRGCGHLSMLLSVKFCPQVIDKNLFFVSVNSYIKSNIASMTSFVHNLISALLPCRERSSHSVYSSVYITYATFFLAFISRLSLWDARSVAVRAKLCKHAPEPPCTPAQERTKRSLWKTATQLSTDSDGAKICFPTS